MVMWNVLVNMPNYLGYLQEPMFDDMSRALTNGEPYSNANLQDRVLTGQEPICGCGDIQ